MKRLMIVAALVAVGWVASAKLQYDFQDTSRRVEVVPSQGASQVASGFSVRLADRARSQSILLSLWHGLLLILK